MFRQCPFTQPGSAQCGSRSCAVDHCNKVNCHLRLSISQYCVWHYSLTKRQSQQVERIQKRAIHVIFNFTNGMSYISMLFAANMEILGSRRDDLSREFFLDIVRPSSCLHCLLSATREQSLISHLHTFVKFP